MNSALLQKISDLNCRVFWIMMYCLLFVSTDAKNRVEPQKSLVIGNDEPKPVIICPSSLSSFS